MEFRGAWVSSLGAALQKTMQPLVERSIRPRVVTSTPTYLPAAAALFSQAVRADPLNGEAWFNMGAVLQSNPKTVRAAPAMYKLSAVLAPQRHSSYNALADLAGPLQEQVQWLRKTGSHNSSPPNNRGAGNG